MASQHEAALPLPPRAAWRAGRLLHGIPCAETLFDLMLLIALGTAPWRMGLFAWRPIWLADLSLEAPIGVGILAVPPLIFFAVWGARRWQARLTAPWQWGAGAVALPLLGLTLLALLGLRGGTERSYIQAAGLGLAWIIYLFVLNQRPRLTPVLACVAFWQGAAALGQLIRQGDLGLAALGESPLSLSLQSVSVLQARGGVWIRAYGLTPSPNVLGASLAVMLLLLLQPLAARRPARGAGLAQALRGAAILLAFAMGLVGLLASFSRAAWIGFALGAGLWLVQARTSSRSLPPVEASDESRRAAAPGRSRNMAARWLALLCVAAFALAYGDLALSRVINLDSQTEARSLHDRERDAALAWKIIQAHPWRGVGTGNYQAATSALNAESAVVHNVPLMVTAEWGILGGALLALLGVAGLRRRSAARPAWLGLLVISLFDLSLWPTTSWHGAILFGVLAAVMAHGAREDEDAYRV